MINLEELQRQLDRQKGQQAVTLVLSHGSKCPTLYNPEWRCNCAYATNGVNL
jgi:hypothetical protein